VDVGGSGCCGNLGGGPVVRVTILGECSGDDTTGLLGNICAAGWDTVAPNPVVYCNVVGAEEVVETMEPPGLTVEANAAVVIGKGWFGSML